MRQVAIPEGSGDLKPFKLRVLAPEEARRERVGTIQCLKTDKNEVVGDDACQSEISEGNVGFRGGRCPSTRSPFHFPHAHACHGMG